MPRNNSKPFEQKLVLSQWVFKLFEIPGIETLQEWLKDQSLEGFDDENISHHHRVLSAHLVERGRVKQDDLLRYDYNIVRHWLQITERRNLDVGRTLFPKYFQYLALLFTEIYLDHYFRNPEGLLIGLNQVVEEYNHQKAERDQVIPFNLGELNKVAFWMATGSGKTLIMHCNLLQYTHYLNKHGSARNINRTLLLTPNEGLSHQHLKEFRLSNIDAAIFEKQSLSELFDRNTIEIIDIHKLSDEHGDKTIDIAAFEGNNLVLVDEGHSGASSGKSGQWMRRREALCENGFSFEYSATFGQAIKSDPDLTQVYAKSVLFDYSYRYFYYDGYGKEYHILNLEDDSNEAQRYRYLSASLLAFYQQQKIYREQPEDCHYYLLEKPLWVFVGGSVKAVYTRNKRKVSDVVDVLLYLAEFISVENKKNSIALIDDFLKGKAGLLDHEGNDIFETSFQYLVTSGINAEETYKDILRLLFNASRPAKIHLENLKGSDGEVGLRLGDNDYFGLINVGDANALCKLANEFDELVVTDQPFSGSIFQQLDEEESGINILIGSRKFMEGWNSWRVSLMGLMNVGRGEGTQIIQLFGRGVRLKGEGFSLKRSTASNTALPPSYIPILETLNIFGVRADYMQQFREYLKNEGIPTEQEKIEFVMPVIKNLGKQKLKVIRVKKGIDFKQDIRLVLESPDDQIRRNAITLNWYPKIQAISSVEYDDMAQLDEGRLSKEHLAFIDYDLLYFELKNFKNEREWYNLSIDQGLLPELLADSSWYKLFIPDDDLQFTDFQRVRSWQEISLALLKKYCDRYYKHRKSEYEKDHYEYQELTEDDPNFFEEYQILYERSREDILKTLEAIKEAVKTGQMTNIEIRHLKAIMFGQHLYQPLLFLGNGRGIEIKPVALNLGEKDFVDDLIDYYKANPEQFKNKELYILRNRSRGKGIGFFQAGNFFPDFIMWLVDGNTQYVSFVDPKGLGRVGIEDPKVNFYQTIKQLEKDLGDKNIRLNSFVLSNTRLLDMPQQTTEMSHDAWERQNVFFQVDDKENYIGKVFQAILEN